MISNVASPKNETVVDDIIWYEQAELHQNFLEIAKKQAFGERMKDFKKLFTEVDACYKLWVTLKSKTRGERHLLLALVDTDEYFSNALPEDFALPNKAQPVKKYHVICGYETEDMDKKLFQLRISQDGEIGEIVWIEKGALLTGSDLMCGFSLMNDALKINATFLKDDAKDKEGIPLRVMRPIARNDEQTWYQLYGFEVHNCRNQPQEEPEFFYNQSRSKFKTAVQAIKKYTLESALSKLSADVKNMLQMLVQRYTPSKKQTLIRAKPETVGGLCERVFNVQTKIAKTEKQSKKQVQAKIDCVFLYKLFLKRADKPSKQAFGTSYHKSVNTLHDTSLFVMKM